jgi:hypothetical protein
MKEKFTPPSQNTVGVCNKITFVILRNISSRLATLHKVIDVPTQFPDIFYITVGFKFMNSTHLFCPDSSSEFAELVDMATFTYQAVIVCFLQIFCLFVVPGLKYKNKQISLLIIKQIP